MSVPCKHKANRVISHDTVASFDQFGQMTFQSSNSQMQNKKNIARCVLVATMLTTCRMHSMHSIERFVVNHLSINSIELFVVNHLSDAFDCHMAFHWLSFSHSISSTRFHNNFFMQIFHAIFSTEFFLQNFP